MSVLFLSPAGASVDSLVFPGGGRSTATGPKLLNRPLEFNLVGATYSADGIQQVLTAVIVEVVPGVLSAGNALVTVTAAGMDNSPKAILVDLAENDDEATVAGKIRAALAADPDVSGFGTISGAGTDVVWTLTTAAANDATANIAYEDGTCVGLAADATSDATTDGVPPRGITSSGDFAGYTWEDGDRVFLINNDETPAEILGSFEVSSRVSDDVIQLAAAAGLPSVDVADLDTIDGITPLYRVTAGEAVVFWFDARLEVAPDTDFTLGTELHASHPITGYDFESLEAAAAIGSGNPVGKYFWMKAFGAAEDWIFQDNDSFIVQGDMPDLALGKLSAERWIVAQAAQDPRPCEMSYRMNWVPLSAGSTVVVE